MPDCRPSDSINERDSNSRACVEVGFNSDEIEFELTALIHAVRQGCRISFARLYYLTQRRLVNIILRIQPNRADAGDVVQMVYLHVWNRCAQFAVRKGRVTYWLTGIAHHSAIDNLRQLASRPQRYFVASADDDEPYEGVESTEPEPFDLVLEARNSVAIKHCLSNLSIQHREILYLAFYDGLSHREISRRLGRPLGTVKSWLRNALAIMRPALAKCADVSHFNARKLT